jgi:hypothetical protein
MAQQTTPAEGPASFRMWAGVVVGPIAWVLQLILDWGLSEVVACAPATTAPPTLLGVPLLTALLILTSVLLAATIASGVGASSHLRGLGAEASSAERFLSKAGVMTAILFGIVITAGFFPIYLTKGCLP